MVSTFWWRAFALRHLCYIALGVPARRRRVAERIAERIFHGVRDQF